MRNQLLTILRLVITIAHVSIGQSSNAGIGITDDGSVISVAVNPSIALFFRCSSSPVNTAIPCGDGATYEDLRLVARAAEAFIHNSQPVQLGLEFDTGDRIIGEDEYHFEGADISATTLTLPPNSDNYLGSLRGSNVQVDNDSIILSGMLHFRLPFKLSPSDKSIPSESYISQLLLAAIVREEDAFLVKLREVTDNVSGEDWLNTVVGYNAQVGGSEFVIPAYRRQLQETIPDDVVSDSGNSTSGINNVWLIVGAAGAAVSLLTLCGGLCYARKSFKVDDGGGGKKKSPTTKGDDVSFQPGKNNPKSSSKLFKKKSSVGKSTEAPVSLPASPPPPPPRTLIDDDDESNADFLLARTALNHSMESNPFGGLSVAGDSQVHTNGDDMSYAFTVDGESLAPMGGTGGNSISPGNINEDAAIGAGGLESFANEKGIFRWNEEGTKMVYTPTVGKSESNEMNGFVFDKRKKKWVVKDQVIGEKSVSFQPNTNAAGSGGLAHPISRIRSVDSAGTGMTGLTGMTDFTYDDVALDWGKRPRSNLSDFSNVVEEDDNASHAMESSYSPSVPQEQGVEVSADDVSAFTGFTDFSPTESPNWVTPERVSSILSDEATTSTFATGEPGRIVRKTPLNKPNKMMIAEETPFDEDETPFDELTRSRYGSNKSKEGIAMHNMLDDLDSQSESGMSTGSANSEQVLQDLDTLSKFMMERKHSSKGQKGGSSSRGSRVGSFGSTSSRNRKFPR